MNNVDTADDELFELEHSANYAYDLSAISYILGTKLKDLHSLFKSVLHETCALGYVENTTNL